MSNKFSTVKQPGESETAPLLVFILETIIKMSQETISEYLNPSRFPRMAFGLKANSTLHRITLTPSNANPGETLYIEIPKLTDNMVIVPGSVFLVFNLAISGHENNTVVNNISRNLVKRQRVVFGGETLQDTMNYDLFQTYHDLFLPKEERENMLRHGISSENMRKLRTNCWRQGHLHQRKRSCHGSVA